MKEIINQSPENIKKTMNSIEDMNKNMDAINDLMPEATKNMGQANELITEANSTLGSINTKLPPIPESLVDNAEKLIIKTDCFETEISKLLSKRGMLLRLLFGNPGHSFKNCAKCNKGTKAQAKKRINRASSSTHQ